MSLRQMMGRVKKMKMANHLELDWKYIRLFGAFGELNLFLFIYYLSLTIQFIFKIHF